MANYEGDVHWAHVCDICLKKRVFAFASLKYGDCSLVVVEQMKEFVGELVSPQLNGHSGVEHLDVTDGGLSWSMLGGKVTW